MWLVAAAVVGFVVGSLSPAVLLGRLLGGDVRSRGSGNPGATNVARVHGARWGVLVLVLDVLKGFLPTGLAQHWLGLPGGLVAGLAVILGHTYSPFLRGRGGKGVATALGAILAVAPWVGLGSVVVFAVAYLWLRVVGRASAIAGLGLFVTGAGIALGVVPGSPPAVGLWLLAVSCVVLLRHRRNLKAWIAPE